MRRIFALTGTPGTGKTTVAALLRSIAPDLEVMEVPDLVEGSARRRSSPGRTVEVDLAQAAHALRDRGRTRGTGALLVVGHLAHLLPVQDVLLLRCRPSVLERRLRRKGVAERWVRENVEAERLDVILLEAVGLDRTLWELDDTDRSPTQVAAWALRVVQGKELPSYGQVDWLVLEPPSGLYVGPSASPRHPRNRARRSPSRAARRSRRPGSPERQKRSAGSR